MEPRNTYHRVIAVVPYIGSGKPGDPIDSRIDLHWIEQSDTTGVYYGARGAAGAALNAILAELANLEARQVERIRRFIADRYNFTVDPLD